MEFKKGYSSSWFHRTRINRARLLIALFLILTASRAIGADSVILKNGRQVDGAVVAQTRDTVRISTSEGIKTIQKTTIRRIIFGRTENKTTKKDTSPLEPAPPQQAMENQPADPGSTGQEGTMGSGDSTGPGFRSGPAFEAALRSALLPGWGQGTAGETGAGLPITAGFLAGAAYAGNRFAAQQDAHRAYDRQARDGFFVLFNRAARNQGTDELKQPLTALHILLTNAAKNTYHTRVREFGQSLSILGFVYLAQIIHAAWTGSASGIVDAAIPSANNAAALTFYYDWIPDAPGPSAAGETPIGLVVSVRF